MKSMLTVGLAGALIMSAAAHAEDKRYIVQFKSGKSPAIQSDIKSKQGKVHFKLKHRDMMAATLSESAKLALEKNPNVQFIEEDVKRYPMSTQEVPYGIPMVQAELLSDGSASTRIVCIIDSGYDLAHEDLSSNVVSGTNDPGTGNWYEDQNHHGTHVAGTIAAVNNGVGVVGVMPNGNINLHIIKVFDAEGWAYSSSLVAALDACEAAGANVINMSLGGTQKSRSEQVAFAAAYDRGVLSIAAAGNDGNTRHSYPASYDSVVSVAAIDSDKVVADFSQQTSQVELAAPGVGVLSSVPMGSGTVSSVTVSNAPYESAGMDGSPLLAATGALVDCGLGDATCNAQGQVCLISRGSISFSDKVLACEAGGGVGAIIYNNEPGMLYGTLGGVETAIPSVGVTDTDGAVLLTLLGQNASISLDPSNYAYFDGTSMATPHVAGVAALVWSEHLDCSAPQIRAVLAATAEDLGDMGRDNAYGFGLIQAKAASDFITANGCDGASGGGDTGGEKPCRGGPKQCPR